jgi:DNA-directed RNA polymerase subunit H (RpoH/RPB5)
MNVTVTVTKESVVGSVKQTVREMMADRGYTDPREQKSTLDTPIWVSCNDIEECFIFFCVEPKLGAQEFRKFQTILDNHKIHHCIVVSNQGITPFTSSMLQSLDPRELEVEIFPYKYLTRNPTRHSLYRPHRALTEQEKTVAVLHTYHAKEEQIPILFRDDRICQYFNYPVGTVVEITRCYGGVGPYTTYRIVQNNQR